VGNSGSDGFRRGLGAGFVHLDGLNNAVVIGLVLLLAVLLLLQALAVEAETRGEELVHLLEVLGHHRVHVVLPVFLYFLNLFELGTF